MAATSSASTASRALPPGSSSLAADAGVKLTPAGATYPYGRDPRDRNLRLAPTLPDLPEIEQAMEVICTTVKLASLEKLTG